MSWPLLVTSMVVGKCEVERWWLDGLEVSKLFCFGGGDGTIEVWWNKDHDDKHVI